MKNIAIIPARGGSKRIPRKNIKYFCGQPIIKYSIDVALNCGVFDEVMVSTDDDEIASVAKKYGAKVPFMRSETNSTDKATTSDVLVEVLDWYISNGSLFDSFCCIYPAAPFITKTAINESMQMMHNHNADTVVPVIKFSAPPQRGFVIENNKLNMLDPTTKYTNSQDLPYVYHDAGQFYCAQVKKYLLNKALYTDNSIPFIIQEMHAHDIDNEDDWVIAEFKYKYLNNMLA